MKTDKLDIKNFHTNEIKVDMDLLFKSFNNMATEEEEIIISKWLNGNAANKTAYRNACDLYDALLLSAPIEVLEGRAPESSVQRRKTLKTVLYGISTAAAVALFCVLGYNVTGDILKKQLTKTMNTITVPAGKSMDYTFADGTTVRLNSGAKLQYPMAFAEDSREVHLDGEAYFDVEHDDRKPFIVKTFASDIEVLGTEFNVNADKKTKKFSAALIEGSVKISNRLHPDEQIVMRPDEVVTLVNGRLKKTDARSITDVICWTDGVFDPCGLRFDELMRKMETIYGVRIIIEMDELPELKYTRGKFHVSDGIDHALRVLQLMADFTFERANNTNTIYIRPLEQ